MSRVLCSSVSGHLGQEIQVSGWLESLRVLGALAFLIIRDRSGIVQAVFEGKHDFPPLQSVVTVRGTVRCDERAPGGHEIVGVEITVLSTAASPLPIEMNDKRGQVSIETALEHRVLSLRNERAAAPLKVKAEFVRCFREFFRAQGFYEVFTPKIVGVGTEGGAELFSVQYFQRKAYLAQSPQLYKQMMVGAGFERVFEVGPVFRAEEHNTSRHLNQFLSLDLEMGFIGSVDDLMSIEEEFMRAALSDISSRCSSELEMYGATVPAVPPIPRLDIDQAIEIAERRLDRRMPPGNLDPEGERALSQAVLEETGSDFVFVTGYPENVRPFYAMPDLARPGKTASFDLIFRGLEVTTGGQRIHDYETMVASMLRRGLDPGKFSGYLEAFKYGMPPHGGLAIGAERVAARLLHLVNLREATSFPRDRTRLEP